MNDSALQVLLVEPNPAQAALVREALSRDRADAVKPVHAECLGEALAQLRARRFDVALLDPSLPDSAGLDALDQVHELAPNVAVILLAEPWDEALALQAMQAGAQDCLAAASLSPETLGRAIRFAIGRQTHTADRRASARRFRALIENSADALALVAADGTIVYETASSQRVLGYAPNDVLGHHIQEFLQPAAQAAAGEMFAQLLRQPGGLVTAELEYRRRDGTWCWVETTANNLLDEPSVQAIVVNYRDITDRKTAQRTQQRYELLSAYSRDIMLFVRLSDRRILDANQAALAAYGYTREELLGLTVNDLRAAETQAVVQAQLAQADRADILFETVHRRKDGSTFPVEVSAGGADLEGERVILSTIRDITERKRAEATLVDLAKFPAQNPNPILRVDRQGSILFANPASAALLRLWGSAAGGTAPDTWRRLVSDTLATQAGQTVEVECDQKVYSVTAVPIAEAGYVNLYATDITERKRAEEALRQSEERLQAAVRVADIGIFDNDLHANAPYWSPRLRDIFGIGAEEAITRQTLLDLTDPQDRRSIEAAIRRAYDPAGDGLIAIEHRLIRRDGAVRWLSARWQMFFEGQGDARRLVRTVGAVLDITERKRDQEALLIGEERLQAAVRAAEFGIFERDLQGEVLYCSPRYREIHGLEPDQVATPESMLNLVHPEDRERVLASIRRAHDPAGDGLNDVEHRIIRADGQQRWVSTRTQTFFAGEGAGRRPVRIIGAVLDITGRKRAQEALRQGEELLRAAVRVADIGVFDHDHRAGHQYWSPRLREIHGVGPDEAVDQQTLSALTDPQDRPLMAAGIRRAHDPAGDGLFDLEHRILRRDGVVRWLSARSQTFFDGEGAGRRAVRTVGAVVDITERKQAEEALRLTQFSVDRASIGIMRTDKDARIVSVNEQTCRMLGYTAEELLQLHVYDIDPIFSLESWKSHRQKLALAGADSFETTHRRKDGSELPVEITNSYIEFDGEPYSISFVKDITARKRAEADLRDGQERLDGIIASAMDAIISLDEDQRVVVFNAAAEQIFGCPAAEALGQPLDRFIPAGRIQAHRVHLERFAHSGTTSRAKGRLETLTARRYDGQEFPMEASISQTLVAGKRFFTVILRDVTERRRHEHEVESIAAVSAALRAAPARAEMLPVILTQVLDLLDASATALDVRDPASGEVTIEAAQGAWAPRVGRHIPADQAIVGTVLASGQPYVSADVHADRKLTLTEPLDGVRTAACVPLVAEGQAVAGLWVGRQAPFTPDDVRLLSAIADIAANAMHRASLHEQTVNRLRQLTALREIDQAISSSMGLPIVLSVVMDQVLGLLRPDAADILLLDSAAGTLDFAAGRGFHHVVASLPLGQGYASQVVLERRLIRRPELPAEAAAFGASGREAGLPTREGFRAYFGVPLTAKGAVVGVLEIFQRAPLYPAADWLEFLEALAGQAAIAIDNARLFEHMQRSNYNLGLAYEATIEGWSRALDLRDRETEGHSQRVTTMALELAAAMGMQAEPLEHMRRGAVLHDIGKMGVPDNILLKPGPLTPDEWVIMRLHPTFAYEMLSPITYLAPALDIPYCHHEKWDGTGYPRRLKGEAIPLAARIFAVVDVWDALRSDRPYRPAWPAEQVREYIRSLAGTHFDPRVVSAAMETGLLQDEPRGG